jgi:hypothetical protein
MSIHVALNHVTHYHDRPVQLPANRLRPAPHTRTLFAY